MHRRTTHFFFSFFLVFVLAVFALYFQNSQVPEVSVTQVPGPSSVSTATSQQVRADFVNSVSLSLKTQCLMGSGPSLSLKAKCPALADAELPGGYFVQLIPESKTKLGRAFLRFFDSKERNLRIPQYFFETSVTDNPDWFSLSVHFVSPQAIYVQTSSHESYPSYFFFDGKQWQKFAPWDLVKSFFPDTRQPPFSLAVSEKYLKLTEENYCCDRVYTDSSDRRANRMVYILDRATNAVVKTMKIPRGL
jgi:hypothetical protein